MRRYITEIFTSVLIAIFMVGISSTALATNIIYDAADQGFGVWEYSYWVSDNTFNEDYGFTVYFDDGLYDNITPTSDSGDWDETSWNPSGGLAGAYDALASTDGASLAAPFTVSFDWLGTGTPWDYTQDFEVYFLSPFQILETGTTAPIPEPATILLVGSGLFGLAGLRKRAKKKLAG